MLPIFEFALNNVVQASTGYTPLYVNGLTHPRVILTLLLLVSRLGWAEMADRLADISSAPGNSDNRVSRNTILCLTTCE